MVSAAGLSEISLSKQAWSSSIHFKEITIVYGGFLHLIVRFNPYLFELLFQNFEQK